MKKLLLSFLVANAFFVTPTFAQKGKIFNVESYISENKFLEAKKEIELVLQDPENQKKAKAWVLKGDANKGIYETRIFYASNPTCLFDAKDAYVKAFELETNVKKQKDFGTPLNMIASYLFNEGLERFNNKKYEDAYKHFESSRNANELLFSKGLVSSIDTNGIYASAMAGINANKIAEVTPMLEKLVSMNFNNASVYEMLADIYDKTNNKTGLNDILKKGLAKFPNSKSLQIVELNKTLDGGDVQESVAKFEKAVISEPNNASLWFNLGVLYDKAKSYDKAKDAYDKALAINPDYGDAAFNIGVMFFNQGVELNKQMNAIDEKDDRDGKKFTAKKAERDAVFTKALPYLEKAYAIDPKNADYKQNLKKVYASMNMLEKAKALAE
ncbi:MAG: tetratricopeptide repeat protein [Saprospirales bacterium]|nr:tetratricopeptide repeat protein [Saprospirales bacterium]